MPDTYKRLYPAAGLALRRIVSDPWHIRRFLDFKPHSEYTKFAANAKSTVVYKQQHGT